METLSNYIAENASAIWTWIIAFMSANLMTIVVFVITIVKVCINNAAAQKQLNDKEKAMVDDFKLKLDELEARVIDACDSNTKKRIEAMEKIASDVNAKNDALTEAEEVTTTSVEDALAKIN